MKRYSRGQLEQPLDREAVVAAADQLRGFDDGFAWIRLQQKWQELKDNVTSILGKHALAQCEYACASGKLQMLEDVYASFEEIIVEGTKNRE